MTFYLYFYDVSQSLDLDIPFVDKICYTNFDLNNRASADWKNVYIMQHRCMI